MKDFSLIWIALRNNCEGQLIEVRELISRGRSKRETAQLLQKYEHLQQQVISARRAHGERLRWMPSTSGLPKVTPEQTWHATCINH